jgi:4-hydroxybenzoate polyprenyltransferase
MSSPKAIATLYKFFSLLSVVRGYNILILVIAQYLAAIFIFSPSKSLKNVVLDAHLLYLVLATTFVVAAGYIINNFYDAKVDRINRPVKAGLDSYVKQETKLTLYFVLNFLGFGLGFLVSIKAALFFAVYIFGIWFYSHKLKRYALIGLISATVLTLLPFFVVFVHFKNFSPSIFVHATFLFLVILVRELIKDLQNLKGHIANNYKTFPVVYGEKKTKQFCILLLVFTTIPTYFLFQYVNLEYMTYYFIVALVTLVFVGILLWQAKQTKKYILLHNILKILLLVGVFCLVFLDTSLLVEKVIDKLN